MLKKDAYTGDWTLISRVASEYTNHQGGSMIFSFLVI